jgi:HSP20 family protein
MNLVRYEPNALDLLSLDRVFDGFCTDDLCDTDTPAVDVREEENRYLMEVDLPGLAEKDIEVKLDNNLLTISSRKEEKKEEKKNGYLIRERRSSGFARSFVLPEGVDREAIVAEFKNGVLNLSVPKLPTVQPRKIEVKVN